MKRWIHAVTTVVNEDGEVVPVSNAIEDMVYEAYDNYRGDSEYTWEDLAEVVAEHLEDPDIYGFKRGEDFTITDIAMEMDKYDDWNNASENEGYSIRQWMNESL